MAGDTHTVNIGADDGAPPWSTLFELTAATRTEGWVLVGGLMVQLHARRAGIPEPRATKDVDLLVDVVSEKESASTIAAVLTSIGFTARVPAAASEAAYRFERGEEQVDVMVADHLPPKFNPRLLRRPAFVAPAGEQAIRRRDTFIITSSVTTCTVQAPDVLGALVGKGAAFIVDNRDPGRHIQDAATLFASIGKVSDLELDALSKNDRKRLTVLVRALSSDTAAGWEHLDGDFRSRGQQALQRLAMAARLDLR